ncbi:MAG: methyltransferase domain-containing protein [Dehalococcoidia bacterium]|nr:methyltransferase domain-containing protein [Dehalococcoidia bacterium]
MNRQERLDINRAAWDAYQADYMRFNLMEHPDFFERLARGDVLLDDEEVELAGDVAGLDLLDTSCASDAKQAFSWANLGARVTACDIAPTAIEIARENARHLGLDVKFHVADAQTLDPISDESQDLVYATHLGWLEDIELAVSTWSRVLRAGAPLHYQKDRADIKKNQPTSPD